MKKHDHHNGVQSYSLLKHFTFALLILSPLAGLSEPIAIPEPPDQGVKLEEQDIKALVRHKLLLPCVPALT